MPWRVWRCRWVAEGSSGTAILGIPAFFRATNPSPLPRKPAPWNGGINSQAVPADDLALLDQQKKQRTAPAHPRAVLNPLPKDSGPGIDLSLSTHGTI
jgi:hypothetical protein